MREHPSAEQLELYVIDALSEGESLTIELHVSECAACAAALAREARIEGALDVLAAHVVARESAVGAERRPLAARSPRATLRLAGGIGAALAMAACALLWLGPARADEHVQDTHVSAARDAEGHVPAAADHLDGG
jgi:anti-sigma factor RsiW